ncbi:MAG TPA: hypothetical protein VFT22_22585 [Kofleriaceae bacterium]|nr:hypothetical protein [Kofleriaceae bacterium]
MIGSWEPPRIERVAAREARRLVVLPTIGLSGDLHQDLGRSALAVEISGSLWGDEVRDQFLTDLRDMFLKGEPVDFVADIIKESELERVLIEELTVEEVASSADSFRYRVVLREYTEPPEPPGLDLGGLDELGLDELGLDIDGLADLGLDLLDLPGLLGQVPDIGDMLSPIKTAAEDLDKTIKSGVSGLFSELGSLLDGSP